MLQLETIFRISIHYDINEHSTTACDKIEKISNKLYYIAVSCGLAECENVIGGACFCPYFIAETYDKTQAEKALKQIHAYLKKYKNITFF